MAVPNTFTNGTVADAAEVNANFAYVGVVPIGTILPWAKSLTGTPALDDRFVECNGQVLSDAESVYNGQTIPNLNGGTYRMLRGASTSGGTGGADTHKHDVNAATQNNSYAGSTGYLLNNTRDTSTVSNLPAYYEVVYIMRVK